jgi:BlaI family transcriptional regulator, penicillinase repressor
MRQPMRDPALSDAEWKVMNAVWEKAGDVSAREVLDATAAETGWAYTTVKTLMDRLVEKGVLGVEVRRNVSWYRARLQKARAVRSAADDLMRRAFGGAVAPLVHHLVQSRRLSPRDRAELRRLLDAEETQGRKQ